MNVFSQEQGLLFEKKICNFCRKVLPERCSPFTDEVMLQMIKKSLYDAESLGLTWQNNLATICLLDIKFQFSVLDDHELREYVLNSPNPDIFFRHLFVEPFSNIWMRFEDGYMGKTWI